MTKLCVCLVSLSWIRVAKWRYTSTQWPSASRSGHFAFKENSPGSHWKEEGCVEHRSDLDATPKRKRTSWESNTSYLTQSLVTILPELSTLHCYCNANEFRIGNRLQRKINKIKKIFVWNTLIKNFAICLIQNEIFVANVSLPVHRVL